MPPPPPSNQQIEKDAREAIDRALERNVPGLEPLNEIALDFAPTARDLIHARGTRKLYHYRPLADEVYRVPLLLVMSLVNRPYIADLARGQSLVEYLLLQGYDVYMIDWGIPRSEHSKLRLEDYLLDFTPDSVARVLEDSGEPDLTLIGYCLGGTLAAMYAALHADAPLKNLICFTTPVNADGMTLYKKWIDSNAFDIDQLVDQLGNIPPELMLASIQALRPLQKQASQMQLLNNAGNDAFVKAHLRFERWAADQVPFPGEVARQLVKDFLRANKLVKGEFQVAERLVDFANIRCPFLHVAAEHDHIVPAEASADLIGLVASEDKTEIVIKGGHVSLVAGGNAVYRLWPQLDRWLCERST